MDAQNEVFALITSFGATGVMFLWLWDVRAALKAERDQHEQTRQRLIDALKDCNRHDDTRRLPVIPEAEKEAYRKRISEPP